MADDCVDIFETLLCVIRFKSVTFSPHILSCDVSELHVPVGPSVESLLLQTRDDVRLILFMRSDVARLQRTKQNTP